MGVHLSACRDSVYNQGSAWTGARMSMLTSSLDMLCSSRTRFVGLRTNSLIGVRTLHTSAGTSAARSKLGSLCLAVSTGHQYTLAKACGVRCRVRALVATSAGRVHLKLENGTAQLKAPTS